MHFQSYELQLVHSVINMMQSFKQMVSRMYVYFKKSFLQYHPRSSCVHSIPIFWDKHNLIFSWSIKIFGREWLVQTRMMFHKTLAQYINESSYSVCVSIFIWYFGSRNYILLFEFILLSIHRHFTSNFLLLGSFCIKYTIKLPSPCIKLGTKQSTSKVSIQWLDYALGN